MSVREMINKNAGIAYGVVALVIVIAGVVIFRQITMTDDGTPTVQRAAFFTVDDGKNYFEDDIDKKPPFLVNGKEAVLAHVFTCGDKEVVGYLERYSPELKAEIEKFKAAAEAKQIPDFSRMAMLEATGHQVKRPGDTTWVSHSSAAGASIINFNCSDGKPAVAMRP
jgi:hypothetical protein